MTTARAWGAAGEYLRDPATLFLDSAAGPALAASNAINAAFFVVLLVLLVVGFSLLPTGLWAFAAMVVLLPFSHRRRRSRS